MLEFLRHSIAMERIGWMLVHSLWQFALVAIVAFALQRTLQRRSAATRYGVLLAAMFVLVAAPVATWLSLWSAKMPAAAVMANPVEIQADVSEAHHPDSPMAIGATSAASPAGTRQATPFSSTPEPIGLVFFRLKARQWIQPRLFDLVLLWLGGALLAAFRPLSSWHTTRRLRTVGVGPAGRSVEEMRDRVARRLRLSRAVDVLQSTWVQTPMVVGWVRPVVLLPLSVVTGLPAVQLELILAHELAHIRRQDCLINLLQTLVETVFFYHPAVWWLSRQIRNEREHCCDDVAMGVAGCRADYGRALLALEELRTTSPVLSLAARGGLLLARIRRIAGCDPAPRFAGAGSALCVILLSLAMYLTATADAAPPEEKPEPTLAASAAPAAAEPNDETPPASPEDPAPKEPWPLTLKEAIRIGLDNSRVMRRMGAVTFSQWKSSATSVGAAPGKDGPTEVVLDRNARVMIARLNTDSSLLEFEAAVRDLVRDTERAYWELHFAYRQLDTAIAGRDSALRVWRQVYAKYLDGGLAQDEAQARQEYFLFRGAVEQALSKLDQAERNLRSPMGLAVGDGRLIRPADEPTTAEVRFDPSQAGSEANRRSPELRAAQWQVKQRELELAAAKEHVASHDGDEVTDGRTNVPVGFRREMAGVRNAQLALARDRALLQEQELELSHQLGSAFRELNDNYALTGTQFNRRRSTENELNALQASYEKGAVTLDVLALAQQRLAEAEIAYHRSLIDYNEAIANAHYRKGSLLEFRGVCLAEDAELNEKARR